MDNFAYSIIAAVSKNGGIGYKGDLPWRLKKEMAYFNRITTQVNRENTQNAVIMGRNTWQSIPDKYRPLKGRINVVISKTLNSVPEGILLYPKLTEALKDLYSNDCVEKCWIIGGTGLYNEAINDKNCKYLYITKINQEFVCDTFFPDFDPNNFEEIFEPYIPKDIQEENGIQYEFKVFKRL
ncbi:Dihydrofolate reductase domain,Dihydrofolate reductase-like domain,Dihydrofolate reductase conserved [Cinara cedri]|uniref:dihydrofolate reductase n=1 Tax=Cinara cedri TaxID=506608 RepID=A0A5E4NDC0_9HEMI|nr:Dihydrofolate reductase domain,Dihydrofolate reductase-like domain,Dihydrofolate reductase conserved [Cinara cedri]